VEYLAKILAYKDQSQNDKIADALRKAGLKWAWMICKDSLFI
jgi:hypothetical protein